MNSKKEMATGGQYAQFGLLLSTAAVEILELSDLSKAEMQQYLTPPTNGKVKEIAQALVSQMLDIKISIWKREFQKVSVFTKQYLNREIDGITFNPSIDVFNDFSHIEYIPADLSIDDVFHAYAKVFGKDKTYCYYHDQHKTIAESIQTQQERPTGDRFILHRGGQEPDQQHLNKSYDDFHADGKTYMIPIEGLMAAFRYRVETGKMMDEKGLTRFHSVKKAIRTSTVSIIQCSCHTSRKAAKSPGR
jgi:hypothetical protein